MAYIYNDGSRLKEIRQGSEIGQISSSFDYDENGSRIVKRDQNGTIIQSYTYDQKRRISSMATLTESLIFQYDPNDYRINKSTTGETSLYLLEGEHFEAVYDGQGNPKATFLRGVVVDEIVNGYLYNEAGQKKNYTFHHDQLRSVDTLTDLQGNVAETTQYGPFGESNETTGSTDNFLKYTGRELDMETGLYYYRARYYDSEIGRFLNEDPMGFEAGVNFYAYVLNNPINYNDPSGKIIGGDDLIVWLGIKIAERATQVRAR